MPRLLMPIAGRDTMRRFSELRVAVVKELAFQGHSPATLVQYEVCYGQFASYLTEMGQTDDVRHFDVERIKDFAHRLKEKGADPNTIRNKLSALSTMARVGATLRDEKGRPWMTGDNPVHAFTWPKRRPKESKYLYAHELAALWRAPCSPAMDIARELLIDTGARVASLCNAKVGDLLEIGGAPFLSLVVKGGARKNVPMSKAAAAKLHATLLARELTDKDDDQYLLVREDGEPWGRTALSTALVRLAKSVGITRLSVSAHKLRHTNSVGGRGAGLDAETRGRLLNHSAETNRRHYDHERPGELAEARERVRRHLEEQVEQGSGEVMAPGFTTAPEDDWELGGFA